jgi:hypothetical protein
MAMLRKGECDGGADRPGARTTTLPRAPKTLAPLLYSELGLMNKNQKKLMILVKQQSYFFIRANCMMIENKQYRPVTVTLRYAKSRDMMAPPVYDCETEHAQLQRHVARCLERSD